MISQKQLAVAKTKVQMLEESLILPKKKNVPNELHSAAKGQIEELISEMKSEISSLRSRLGSGKGSFASPEEADAFIRSERNKWE